MARAYADTIAVQNCGEVGRVHLPVGEGNHASAMIAWSEDRHPLDLRQFLNREPRKLLLMLGHAVHTEVLQVTDRRGEPDGALHVRSSAFELVGHLVPRR